MNSKTTPPASAAPSPDAMPDDGLSLRDRAALAAITGCLSSSRHFDKAALAAEAYELADAMVAASQKDPK